MANPARREATYDPSVFLNVTSVDDAVRIILTPEEGMTSAHRWTAEAPYLMTLLDKHIEVGSKVLDYGCGIGRLSKPLIERNSCSVVGVDISPNMRALATSCVESDRFCAVPPSMLPYFSSFLFDAAIAVWTLQHCLEPRRDIENIWRAVRKGGVLFIVNNIRRAVPTSDGQWTDDGLNIDALICKRGFKQIERGQLLDAAIAPGWMKEGTFWAAYRK